MATAEEVQFSLKVTMIKESCKVVYAEVDSDFADVLLSFLTLPLGTIVRLLIKHYRNDAPILGSLNSLYAGLQNMDDTHFFTKEGKLMLLNPRNASGIQCRRLKLQIDDTPPTQYFMCGCLNCACVYYNMKCPCANTIMTTEITRKDFETEAQSVDQSVFTEQTASFLLTDDLQILANTSASFFQILKVNGIEDTKLLEERTLIFGLKEIMELLKGSLVSNSPITDIILSMSTDPAPLHKRNKFPVMAKPEPEPLPQNHTSKNIDLDSKKITLKALLQKSTKRVLLAQSRQDLIDLLFSLLAIPLGRVQFHLGNKAFLGSIGNLYRTTSNLVIGEDIKSRENINSLLEPQIPSHYLSFHHFFSLNQEGPVFYKGYENNKYKLFCSPPANGSKKMVMIDPKGQQDSFFKGGKMFMVADDLTVSTPPSTSILSTLNKMGIPPSDVEEQELGIGMEEALSILKASLTSTWALTEGLKPFLKRQPKQEN